MDARRHQRERTIRRHAGIARVVYGWVPDQLGKFAKMKPGDCSCAHCRFAASTRKYTKRDRRWNVEEV